MSGASWSKRRSEKDTVGGTSFSQAVPGVIGDQKDVEICK